MIAVCQPEGNARRSLAGVVVTNHDSMPAGRKCQPEGNARGWLR
ncbi:hypothetical protein [Robertkochia aurantiaca]|nr:hypothetical protein [Robertkochia sp. 3YJGBD-33]